jgi:hypothetical protein
MLNGLALLYLDAEYKMHLDAKQKAHLPYVQTLGKHVAVLGMTGSGKTNTAYVWAEEELRAGGTLTILDPEGDFHHLRNGAEILIIGNARRGNPLDVEISIERAGQAAELLTRRSERVILDLSGWPLGSKNSFVLAYVGCLWAMYQYEDLPPMRLIIDEVQLFAPQGPQTDAKELIQDIAARGRKRGLALLVASQRPQNVDKAVLDATDIRFLHRVPRGRTLKVYDDLLPGSLANAKDIVPGLDRGEAIFMIQDDAQVIQVRQSDTFRPEDKTLFVPPPLMPGDSALIDELKALLTVPLAAADQPELIQHLREENARLRSREVERVEVPVISDAQVDQLTALAEEMREQAQLLIDSANEIMACLKRGVVFPAEIVVTEDTNEVTADGDLHLRAGERRILEVLARRHPTKLTRAQLGTLSGFTPSGGTFGTYFGTLKRNALLVEQDGEVSITQDGFDYLGMDRPRKPQTTNEVLTMWRNALRSGEWRMLDVLVGVYPRSLSRKALGDTAGYEVSGGTFGTYLGTLRRNGLVDVRGDQVAASRTLFLNSSE